MHDGEIRPRRQSLLARSEGHKRVGIRTGLAGYFPYFRLQKRSLKGESKEVLLVPQFIDFSSSWLLCYFVTETGKGSGKLIQIRVAMHIKVNPN